MALEQSRYKKSSLWNHLEKKLFPDTNIELSTFREPGALNSRLAAWDPYDGKSFRYYKNILYNLITSMPQSFFNYYQKIGNTHIGNPVFVTVKQLRIDLDYAFSVQEILFCEDVLKSIKSICEIGAGFGRTCHAVLRNFPHISKYMIIDIPSCLELSQRYLKEVLDFNEFQKVQFIENKNASEIEVAELFINIDSFAEMDADVTKNYMSLINDKGNYFYSRNPVCKYHPSIIGLANYDETQLKNAMSAGLCREIVDIFNDEELKLARGKYLERYCPSESWNLLRDEASLPWQYWQYYHHALFTRSDEFVQQ